MFQALPASTVLGLATWSVARDSDSERKTLAEGRACAVWPLAFFSDALIGLLKFRRLRPMPPTLSKFFCVV